VSYELFGSIAPLKVTLKSIQELIGTEYSKANYNMPGNVNHQQLQSQNTKEYLLYRVKC
jgi:hypothetical protein